MEGLLLEKRRPSGGLLRRMFWLLAASGLLGFLFNLAMPQGVGLLPPEVAAPKWRAISLAQGKKALAKGAFLVDASDAGAYKKAHAKGAVNLYPKDFKLLFPLLKPQLAKAPAVLVYGAGLSRFPAATIAQRMKEEGLEKVFVLKADVNDLARAGFAIRKRRQAK